MEKKADRCWRRQVKYLRSPSPSPSPSPCQEKKFADQILVLLNSSHNLSSYSLLYSSCQKLSKALSHGHLHVVLIVCWPWRHFSPPLSSSDRVTRNTSFDLIKPLLLEARWQQRKNGFECIGLAQCSANIPIEQNWDCYHSYRHISPCTSSSPW